MLFFKKKRSQPRREYAILLKINSKYHNAGAQLMHTNIDLCSHTLGQECKNIVILSVLLFSNSQHTDIDINFILKLLKKKLNSLIT